MSMIMPIPKWMAGIGECKNERNDNGKRSNGECKQGTAYQ